MKKKLLFLFFKCIIFVPVNAQLPNSEVWLFPYSGRSSTINFMDGKNISNNPGYDNQPFFSADSRNMLWTSEQDSGQTDIFSYNLTEHVALRLTQTKVSEYSPEYIPNDHYFSAVVVEKDSTQRLWKYDLRRFDTISKPSMLLLPEVKNVAYSRWYSSDLVVVCLLPEPMHLAYINPKQGNAVSYAENAGRAMQVYTRKKKKIFLYTQMNADSSYSIHSMTGIIPGVFAFAPVPCLKESQDFVVDGCGHILMARGAKIFKWIIGKSTEWEELIDLEKNGIHSITRMAISPDGKHLALVDNMP
ncbi:hypothetical protein BH11BAC7_BH11BAC7_29280 [soil metagenome]